MVTHTRKGNTTGNKPPASAKGSDTKHDEAVAKARENAMNALEAAGLGADKTEWTPAELAQRDEILAEHGVSDDPGILDTLGIPSPAATTGGTDAAKRGKRIPEGTKPAQALRLHVDDDATLFGLSRLDVDDEATETTFNVLAGRMTGLAKKVGEKAVNLVRHQSARDSVQVYTRIALDFLIYKGEFTAKELMAVYAKSGDGGNGYSPGTQAAQSNQIMQLFPALKIADRPSSDKLVLRDESAIVANFAKSTGSKLNSIGAAAANRAAKDAEKAAAADKGDKQTIAAKDVGDLASVTAA